MRKNLSGAGSVRPRPDGRWEVRWYSPGPNGRPQRHSAYAKNAGEARTLLAEKIRNRDLGVSEPKPLSGRLTVNEVFDRWLEYLRENKAVRPASWQTYRQVVNNRLRPHIGHLKLLRLNHAHLDYMYAKLAKEGLKPHSIKSAHSVLRSALTWARREGLLVLDPTELARPPSKPTNQQRGLTLPEVVRTFQALQGHPEEALFVTAILGGFRFGELAGLHWHDVDLDKRLIHVEKAMSQVTGPTAKLLGLEEKVFLQAPKTASSVRTVPMPARAIELLTRLRLQQRAQYMAKGLEWSEDCLVFQVAPNRSLHQTTINEHWHDLQTEMGVPADRQVRFHDTRRTMASLGAGAGRQRDMMDRLGHSSEAMTNHYTDPDNQLAIVDYIEAGLLAEEAKLLREAQ